MPESLIDSHNIGSYDGVNYKTINDYNKLTEIDNIGVKGYVFMYLHMYIPIHQTVYVTEALA